MTDRYRVIKIMDSYTILINYGFSKHAQAGDRLRVFIPGEEIIDPVTNRPMGTLDKIKAVVQVITPYEHFSVCQKLSTKIIDILNPLSAALSKTVRTKQKLNTLDENNETVFDNESHDPIIIGDMAILLPEER